MHSKISFQPPLWATLATALLCALMIWAGFWQRSRGLEKQAMITLQKTASAAPGVSIMQLPLSPAHGSRLPALAIGVYQPQQTLLLDNQSHHQLPGVHVLTALLLVDGSRVIVDRGWLPLGIAPTPPPAGEQSVSGLWRALPVPGMRLGNADAAPCLPLSPASKINYPDMAQLRCQWGASTRDGLLELSPSAMGGFTREWTADAEAIPPMRHYAYAAQWWLFAVTLLILYIRLNLKRPEPASESPP
jgi:cytochrome oxidase assembly protein ShyY1